MKTERFINWPTDLEETGENGTFVYAFVLATLDGRDPVVHCHGVEDVIGLPEASRIEDPFLPIGTELVASPGGRPDELALPVGVYRIRGTMESRRHHAMSAGFPVIAAVLLGSTHRTWCGEHGIGYWHCTHESLTTQGAELVSLLCRVYGRSVRVLTYLDT